MGFLSGDNIKSITVGKNITTNAPVDVYSEPGGDVIGTVPAGYYLGRCNNAKDGSLFFLGGWWLSFPGNEDMGPFWVQYDDSTLLVNDKPPRDNAGFNQLLPEGLQNFFGSLKGLLIILLVVGLLSAAAFFIYRRFSK